MPSCITSLATALPLQTLVFGRRPSLLWHEQGLPEDVYFTYIASNTEEFFGMDFGMNFIGIRVESGLCPGFEEEILEEHGNRILLQQADGVIVKHIGS